jgi:alpha-mannosidase
MSKRVIHLVCNAHLDPVWQWTWEDGLTETLSTFRVAADFCDEHAGFVFNHNEALLYHWVETYEPALFKRIRKHVRAGRWHIAGGAWLQPDVNNPNGESHIRQFLLGLDYFQRTFRRRPTTAYNFDPFGHPEGFQQILRGCGMDSYIFCRPDYGTHDLPVGTFRWRSRCGAEVMARRSDDHYHYLTRFNLPEKLDEFLPHFAREPQTMILWGLGNHGGGPSRVEYEQLLEYFAAHPELELRHSTPERFFASIAPHHDRLPIVVGEIQESFNGCYTSMARLKRSHRETESLMAATERLCALAWWHGRANYPAKDLDVAWKDLLFSQFHDALPGSGVPQVEHDTLALLGHAREKLRRLRFSAVHALIGGKPAAPGAVPIFVVNPHGARLEAVVEVDYAIDALPIRGAQIVLRRRGRKVAFQQIEPPNNLSGVWVARIAIPVDLAPWEVQRFEATYVLNGYRRPRLPAATRPNLELTAGPVTIQINPKTGLVDRITSRGQQTSYVRTGAFCPVVFDDGDNCWTAGDPAQIEDLHKQFSQIPAWKRPSGRFRRATAAQTAALSPLPVDKWTKRSKTAARAVRIVESGALRTVVEAIFVLGHSAIVRHYVVDRKGGFEIRDRILYNHKDTMLKIEVPLGFAPDRSISESPHSAVERVPTKNFEEQTNQRWVAVTGTDRCITVSNTGSFAHNLTMDGLYLNVLRSPAYTSANMSPNDPWHDRRFQPRQDQGEHEMRYAFQFGRRFNEAAVVREADALNVPPVWQIYYPDGRREPAPTVDCLTVDRKDVRIVAVKKAEAGRALIVRLLDHGGRGREVGLRVGDQDHLFKLGAYALKTLQVRRRKDGIAVREMNLVEGL